MPYTPTEWVDEVPASTPIKYIVTDDINGVIASSATITLVTPVTAGTPINAANLNKHEDAIELAVEAAEAAAEIVKTQVIEIQVVHELESVDVDIHRGYFFVPQTMNGMTLVRATAMVETPGVTGSTTVQIRNMTKYPSNNALSTAISIASGGVVATPGTINALYDDVSTDDKIKIYIVTTSTTKPKGLWVVMEYLLP